MEDWACTDCLRRSWLLAELSPYIAKSVDNSAGRRAAELLALSNSDLIAALAPRKRGQIEARLAPFDRQLMQSRVVAGGSWAICRHSERFPSGLYDLGDPPAALFGRGDPGFLEALANDRVVTVVGARRASGYGLTIARDLGRELALAGFTVVSGLALGIDAAAHNGALETGLSVAVLGCGVDLVYPPRHRPLYQRHLERGLILSELPVGTEARRWTFPARNRIMAAMAAMTVVVEARERSGSLITATMAQELGRDLGAVPGPVTSSVSAGPNHLLSQGACLIRDAQDVLDALLGPGRIAIAAQGPKLEPELRRALECFERSDGNWEMIEAELSRVGILAYAALGQLEALGYLSCSALGAWSRTALKHPQSNRP